jgi:YHS domain-containing protein
MALCPESSTSGQLRTVSHVSEPAARELPIALDGYCPVELNEHEQWVAGDSRFKTTYRGKTYLFSSAAQRDRFQADPKRYAPVYSGNDLVLAAEGRENSPGRTEHSAIYQGRVYLFASPATYARFKQHPERYAKQGNQASLEP